MTRDHAIKMRDLNPLTRANRDNLQIKLDLPYARECNGNVE
jgi:hypothetical protein